MHAQDHSHVFGQDRQRPGERRTVIVIAITVVTMAVEIAAGIAYGSMALLADGLHMGSHAAALGLAAFAYVYARRHAGDERFSFGTGKVNALAGFTGAVILAGFAIVMLAESVERFLNPVAIGFNQALLVAVAGLVVNGVSVLVLDVRRAGRRNDHGHDQGHDHGPDHGHEPVPGHDHVHDHNLRSAYLHVMADALTSLLAIAALAAGKYFGASWMDPLIGVLGAVLVLRWARGLLLQSGRVLLDFQAPPRMRERVAAALEQGGINRITDLHIWSIGPGYYAAAVALQTASPREPEFYRGLLPRDLGLAHVTLEVVGKVRTS